MAESPLPAASEHQSENGVDRPEKLSKEKISWGSDAPAAVLRALEIEYVALVPGASFRGFHDSLVNYLGNVDPQIVLCLHEEHAVSIADGYAKVKERPMAAVLHSNVGLMHATMTIFNAWCERTPMLIFGATGPIDADKRRPWIDWIHTAKDQGALVRNYVKWDDQPASPKACVESVLRAYQIARTPPYGPVYLCLDAGMQEAKLNEEIVIPPVARYVPAAPPAVPRESLDNIWKTFGDAKFPIILMGRVSRDPDDWARRVQFAEAIGCPVLTSLHNPAAFPTVHPLHVLAPCPERPGPEAGELLNQADLILSLDWLDLAGFLRSHLGQSQTQQPSSAKIIGCSLDSYLTNGWSMDHQALPAVDIPVLATPDTLVAQLMETIDAGAATPLAGTVAKEFTHWLDHPRKSKPSSKSMDLRNLAYLVDEFMHDKAVTLARIPIGWPGDACRYSGPMDYLGKDAGGAVGTGPGHVIGAALALKDSGRVVMGVIGDGDFVMGANALWTASHLNVPVLLVVANNQSYFNDEVHQERIANQRNRPVENKWIGQRLNEPAIDLVALAKAQDFEGEGPVFTSDEFKQALKVGATRVKAGARYLIDARIERGYAEP